MTFESFYCFGKFFSFLSVLGVGIFCSLPAFAQAAATEAVAEASTAPVGEDTGTFLGTKAVYALSAALILAIAAAAGSFSQANAAAKALEGMARNPEASGKLQTMAILSLAFIESLTIYALVISLMLVLKL